MISVWNIDLLKPRFGGHIERLMGTFATDIHAVPGTTFSNIFQRKDYDSDTQAVLHLQSLRIG